MKRITKIAVALGAALSLGLAAAAVEAQPYGMGSGGGHMGAYGAGPGYGMGAGMMGGYAAGPGYNMGRGMTGAYGPGYGMGPQATFNTDSRNAEEGLVALKSELGITAKQDPAWQTFADNARQQNERRQAWFARMQEARGAGSAPELLEQQAELMQQRQAEMEANSTALKNLYATLTPEQKVIADQRFGGFAPGWTQGTRNGPRGYAR